MVLPILLVGAGGVALGYFLLDETTGELIETTEEIAQDLGDVVEMAVEELSALVGNLGNSLLDFVKGFGIAVLQGASDTVDYILDETKEYQVPVVQTLTSLAIWAATGMVIYRMIVKVN